MTVTEDQVDEMTETEDESQDEADGVENEIEETTKGKRGRIRDFSKSNDHYDALTEFINADKDFIKAELNPVTSLQVKAILALKTDYANQPGQKEAREARKIERAEADKKFDGMTADQKKAAKIAERAQKQYDKLNAKAAEALQKAQKYANASTGSGEDLAALVAEAQGNAASNGAETPAEQPETVAETPAEPKKRGLGRRR